jgi:two-component system, chemotaxis family, CheB/CheR fusion protein
MTSRISPPTPPSCYVAIGASAGGLEATTKVLARLPLHTGFAFIYVQHMPSKQPSMMADIISARTKMPVQEAREGVRPMADHLYINAPGVNLILRKGVFQTPPTQAGSPLAKLGFDLLLTSLAQNQGAKTVCVVLSGGGADGAIGLQAIKQAGGYVLVQEPSEAGADGMPLNAIATGDVDLVLPAAQIPAALMNWTRLMASSHMPETALAPQSSPTWLQAILEVLAEKTGIDFQLYKTGTLSRRVIGRMRHVTATPADEAAYLALLRTDQAECEALVADMLINVTRFFRDPTVFEALEKQVFPEMIAQHDTGTPLRLWIAACSSGEEVWSVAMLLHEAIEQSGKAIAVQIFASDLDNHAITTARAALYGSSILSDVSKARLERYFVDDGDGYRVRAELRAWVVFAVQNLLSDPPFARVDFLACRNLLIYLNAAAQAKAMALFHFALRPGGVLMLGAAETPGDIETTFAIVSKSQRLYRRRPSHRSQVFPALSKLAQTSVRPPEHAILLRQSQRADDQRQILVNAFSPACALIQPTGNLIYALGPIERFLHVAGGPASQNVLTMLPLTLRATVRDAIANCSPHRPGVFISSGESASNGTAPFEVEVRAAPHPAAGEIMLAFRELPPTATLQSRTAAPENPPRCEDATDRLTAELLFTLQQLEAARAAHLLEHAAATELREEYQSTTEELLTSKEELQSLNEELTVLNSQLQDTLERQRSTFDDLQNVLMSSDIATLVLDLNLHIRFFTPATKSLFGIVASDVGRPLADLRSLLPDESLLDAVKDVLQSALVTDVEIAGADGAWFQRKISPYMTATGVAQGVVVTYANISVRHAAVDAQTAALKRVELVSKAKSRFLAAASHDLRQPLQTLSFVHGLLLDSKDEPDRAKLLARMDHTLGSMSAMLNALLDINQIEAGLMTSHIKSLDLAPILESLKLEFGFLADAKGLPLRIVPSHLHVRSDRRLLVQMLRNLLANAIKFTAEGRVLFGVRRRGDVAHLQVWDSGIGLAASDIGAIFEEYYQVGEEDRGAGDGLGLGLAIVRRLADLLGHRVHVDSSLGRGSMFAIAVPLATAPTARAPAREVQEVFRFLQEPAIATSAHLLVVDDDPTMLASLAALLRGYGFQVTTAPGVDAAITASANTPAPIDLLIADYNLPGRKTGVDMAKIIRAARQNAVPVIILTGDITVATRQTIHRAGFLQMNKPVKATELKSAVLTLLEHPQSQRPPITPAPTLHAQTNVVIIDDHPHVLETLGETISALGYQVQGFSSGEEFFIALTGLSEPGPGRCLLCDAYLGGMSGLDVLATLPSSPIAFGAVMMTGRSDVETAVAAMKSGAIDFLEKPLRPDALANVIQNALAWAQTSALRENLQAEASAKLASLSAREREIMVLVLAGHPSKNIAADLGINQRTVENHRASIMRKTGAKSIPALARLAVIAVASP